MKCEYCGCEYEYEKSNAPEQPDVFCSEECEIENKKDLEEEKSERAYWRCACK